MQTTSRTWSRLGLAAALAALVATVAPPASAQELITPPVKDRRFPQGVFCPLPIDVAFVANGPTATIRFSTNVFLFDNNDQAVEWSEQYLDNIAVAPISVYNANLGAPGGYSSDCYFGETIATRFYFQNAGALPLLDTFDTDPVSRGWDMSQGAYWSGNGTAPHDPGTELDFTPSGSLGLGQDSANPSLSDSAVTSVTVSGLTAGGTYVLTGWWDARNVVLGQTFLTIRVYGTQGPTPIVRRTLGELKRRYR